MRSQGSPGELEHRRFLAVTRALDGYSNEEIADFLGVDLRSVRRWLALYREEGWAGLAAQASSGRPAKLSHTQEKIVLRWLREPPSEHGFDSELWTCSRLAQLIEDEFGVGFNPRSLARWLSVRGLSPQKPQRIPRERNQEVIDAW